MYHAVIGKRLVDCVNRRDDTDYSVREFFDTVYVPLFFGSQRLMQNINNSPFDQAITKQHKPFTEELMRECLDQVHRKVKELKPDASFYIGGPAAGNAETTSGQVTDMQMAIPHDDVYASWIGAALALTVQGGLTLLIADEDVLLYTYDGWYEYRRYLDQTPNLKPMQINTWNGQWLTHRMGRSAQTKINPKSNSDGKALETQGWVQLLFSLSFHYREGPGRQLLAYVCSLGQSNTTVGFIRLNLPQVRLPVDLYEQLYTVPHGMPHARFEALYDTEMSFRSACQSIDIGLRALKPKDAFGAERGIPKRPHSSDSEKQLAFDTYQIWITAMLNNKELLQRADDLAHALYTARSQAERGKTVMNTLVEAILQARNRREFIEGLTALLQKDPGNSFVFERAVADLLSISVDNVSLFITLLRFKYAVVSAKD